MGATKINNDILELSIVMPCLNESETLGVCIHKCQTFIKENNLKAEVVIADNGSTDGSLEIAEKEGARIVNVERKGYGSALINGIKASNGRYVIMGDADDSYDFSNLMPFVELLRKGNEMVIGNRFRGGIAPGAMPFLHRYLGNPVLSFLGRLFYRVNIGDFHCGLRGFSRKAFDDLGLKAPGMELASEMIAKAALKGLKIVETPTTLSPDGRSRPPHLNTWSDGWRHLRFLLLFSPKWVFLFPGIILTVFSFLLSLILIKEPLSIGSLTFDVHTLLYTSTFFLIGAQLIFFYMFTRIFGSVTGIHPETGRQKKFWKSFTLERGVLSGSLIFFVGFILAVLSLLNWKASGFSELLPSENLRNVIPSVVLIILGTQIIFYSVFFSVLGWGRDNQM